MEFTFVDPREYPSGARISLLPRTTSEPSVLRELHRLCRENRIYDVERWIKDGKPLQTIPGEAQKGQTTSAMEIALESRNQGLLLLLLCNGYDPNLERDSPLDSALRSRRWDLLDLLLEWGAHPMRVSVGNLLDTYDSKLFERFRALGVDFTVGHKLAYALGYHTLSEVRREGSFGATCGFGRIVTSGLMTEMEAL